MHYLKYTYPTLPLTNLIKRIPSVTTMRRIDHFRLCTRNLEKSIQEQSSWGLFLRGVGLQRRSPAGTEDEACSCQPHHQSLPSNRDGLR
ncbi:hypothetical protein TNCT_317871 [Trichonephila clavata]|uniref:Uncharacterized protein n=1 Tax=Trichonephila clavata TaxID=2740835 RepID=A0A8X6I5X8_TRICU|nr:hypothetical protein TNCT_317871 [Trichonephila clavata]